MQHTKLLVIVVLTHQTPNEITPRTLEFAGPIPGPQRTVDTNMSWLLCDPAYMVASSLEVVTMAWYRPMFIE